MKRNGIAVAGTLLADVFYNVETYPREGMLVGAKASGLSAGGIANAIIDLAKLDNNLPVTAVASLGEDEVAEGILSAFAEHKNIRTDLIKKEGASSRTLVFNSADTKQRTFFFIPESSDRFSIDHIDFDKIDSKIFLLEYLLLLKTVDSPDQEYGTHGARILAEAKRRGMITAIDAVSEASDRAKSIVTSALRYTDICSLNELEASAVTGIPLESLCSADGQTADTAAKSAIEALRAAGVSKWIIIHKTDCAWGCDLTTADPCIEKLESLRLPESYIKGSTGAGDAFLSGILYGAHENYSLRDSMRLARACAAASLSENNGIDGMRPLSEVMKLEELYL